MNVDPLGSSVEQVGLEGEHGHAEGHRVVQMSRTGTALVASNGVAGAYSSITGVNGHTRRPSRSALTHRRTRFAVAEASPDPDAVCAVDQPNASVTWNLFPVPRSDRAQYVIFIGF